MTAPAAARKPDAPPDGGQPRYFPVSVSKVAVLSLCTVGLYQFYWFYRNWRLERAHTGERLWPIARAVFAPLFAYSLFQRIRREADADAPEPAWSAGLLGVGYFLLNFMSWRVPDPWWIALSLATALPLMLVQQSVNQLNALAAPGAPSNRRFSRTDVVLIVLGGLLWLLVLADTFVPAESAPAEPTVIPERAAYYLLAADKGV